MSSVRVKLAIDLSVRGLCRRPYPNHKKGCPNFGKKDGCPPASTMIGDTINLFRPIYAVYNVFDFVGHVERMTEKHPGWTKRQVECCLYWQPRARKHLREKIVLFLMDHPGLTVVHTPEAQGVNLTETMRRVGIELEWPPVTKTYQIVLAGNQRESE